MRHVMKVLSNFAFPEWPPSVRNPPPTFRRHFCQYRVPSNFIHWEGSVLYVETKWPAWIFELGLLKFSQFVSNSLRNLENDVQISQLWRDELLNLPEKLIFEGVFRGNIFLNSFFRKSTLAIFFRYPFEVLLFVMQTCEVKYDRYFSIHSAS